MSMLSRWTGRSNGRGMESNREGRDEMSEMTRPMMNLQQQINRVFEEFFDDFPMMGRRGPMSEMMQSQSFQPRVDLSETSDALRVTADVPGMTEDDIDVTVSGDTLTITGERSETREDEEEDMVRRERSYGMFRRRLPLPAHIDRDNINATFKNGVLTVELPKTEEARGNWRKIEVKGE